MIDSFLFCPFDLGRCISSLLLGIYEKGSLVYVGRVGSGLNARGAAELERKFADIKRGTSSFKQVPKARSNEEVFWVEPCLVAEVKFGQCTEDNLLRQASFIGLRTDIDPKGIHREKANEADPPITSEEVKNSVKNELIIENIKITHPDKVLFDDPRITKEDVVLYYESV